MQTEWCILLSTWGLSLRNWVSSCKRPRPHVEAWSLGHRTRFLKRTKRDEFSQQSPKNYKHFFSLPQIGPKKNPFFSFLLNPSVWLLFASGPMSTLLATNLSSFNDDKHLMQKNSIHTFFPPFFFWRVFSHLANTDSAIRVTGTPWSSAEIAVHYFFPTKNESKKVGKTLKKNSYFSCSLLSGRISYFCDKRQTIFIFESEETISIVKIGQIWNG